MKIQEKLSYCNAFSYDYFQKKKKGNDSKIVISVKYDFIESSPQSLLDI